MANILKIKRSAVTSTPTTLAEGELAYSELSGNLFIGTNGGVDLEKIGGNTDVQKLAGIEAGAQVNTVTSVASKTGAVTLVKADITDFTESDYVHTTGVETIAGNKTFSNNIIITGDLTVNGTTTTVNSTTVALGDNIIVLNSGEAGTPSLNAGLEIERGTSTNAFLVFDESDDTWKVDTGTATLTAISLAGHTHSVALDDLSDVAITGAAKGDILVHNGTNFVDLTVGTNGQILSADSAEATGVKWITNSVVAALDDLTDVVITGAAKGDMLVFNGTSWIDVTVGANDTILMADSAQASGVKWIATIDGGSF